MPRTVLWLNVRCGSSYWVHQEILEASTWQGSLSCVVPFALCFGQHKPLKTIGLREQLYCCLVVFEGAFPLLLWSSHHVVPSASVLSCGLSYLSAGAHSALSSTSSMLVQKHSMRSVGYVWQYSVPFLFNVGNGQVGMNRFWCYRCSLSDRGEKDILSWGQIRCIGCSLESSVTRASNSQALGKPFLPFQRAAYLSKPWHPRATVPGPSEVCSHTLRKSTACQVKQ